VRVKGKELYELAVGSSAEKSTKKRKKERETDDESSSPKKKKIKKEKESDEETNSLIFDILNKVKNELDTSVKHKKEKEAEQLIFTSFKWFYIMAILLNKILFYSNTVLFTFWGACADTVCCGQDGGHESVV
jgi:uncharacterized FlaG/YvyC family protein